MNKTFKELRLQVNDWYYTFLYNHLNATKGNVSEAARNADMDRSNFLRMCRDHDVNPAEFRRFK